MNTPQHNSSGCLHQPCSPSGVEAAVCDDIAKRQQVGIAKYKMTVAENSLSLREWLQHAYEECLDQAVYLRRAMDELPAPPPEPDPFIKWREKYFLCHPSVEHARAAWDAVKKENAAGQATASTKL